MGVSEINTSAEIQELSYIKSRGQMVENDVYLTFREVWCCLVSIQLIIPL